MSISDRRENEGEAGRLNAAMSSPVTSDAIENTQINKFHTKGGTGFAAEEANALADRLAGRKVDQVGGANTLNGADRIVDGVPVQTKYFENASRTVNSAFDEVGNYRYSDQMLEVPSDQYEEALGLMREKIAQGKVPGVTDPEAASEIVRKGDVTYRQASNLARAGNIDSLVFDAKLQAVACGYAFGLSFAVSFAKLKWNGMCTSDALKESLLVGLSSGATSFVAGVAARQFMRSEAAAWAVPLARDGVRILHTTALGKATITKIAEVSLGRAVHGAAAINHVSKLLRSNAVVGAAATIALSGPDFYRAAFSGSISWAQFGKNVAVNAAGAVGWMGGAAAGAAAGSVAPGLGTVAGGIVGGIVGALGGGFAAGAASKSALDLLVEDDAKEMLRILQECAAEIADEYLLSPMETELFWS